MLVCIHHFPIGAYSIQNITAHQKPLSTMLATFKNVLFPGHNHLLTTCTDGLTLWLSPELYVFSLSVITKITTTFGLSRKKRINHGQIHVLPCQWAHLGMSSITENFGWECSVLSCDQAKWINAAILYILMQMCVCSDNTVLAGILNNCCLNRNWAGPI